MNEWIINYESEEALAEIKKIGEIAFESRFKELKFIIMTTEWSKEAVMNIKGVTECREPRIGTVYC